ncbi:MAG: translocation/assembly module TamB domain-containing protein, partial [Acidobacteriia bacterium]|nr:translocation/assembly module TamB domain-containing protein [Methyloceanibacter sp.]MCL6492709.1 translocation/assembly module TamB domain-containing protein [Terriglobia bacterium]
SGEVSFNGTDSLAGAHGIDPFLNFVATSVTTYENAVATLRISGYASDPKITLSSTPPLPQDTIMALLLFGQPAATLSPFQAASLAAGLAQLSGNGGGDVMNDIRRKLGLDRLSIGTRGVPTGATAGTASATQGALAPTLQAGRYVAPGVYVGAQQSVSGGNYSTVQVQIDLSKRLKLQAGAGSGPGANALGLIYQWNY